MELLFEKEQSNRDYFYNYGLGINMNKYCVNKVIKSIGGEFYDS
jgi:hypothetical protein